MHEYSEAVRTVRKNQERVRARTLEEGEKVHVYGIAGTPYLPSQKNAVTVELMMQ